MTTSTTRLRDSERGSALIVSLLLMMTLSMLGASFMFLAQTETASSISYRTMSQARYGAESGVHKAINHLLNTYAKPGTVADPLANYNLNVSPVTYNNQPVILSSNPAVPSNYPIAAVQTAFNNAVQGTLPAGLTTVTYNASAKLMSMIPITTYAGQTTVVQTWLITADGIVGGVHSANVEVTSTIEQQIVPAVSDAAFATGTACGALSFGGNEVIDSYDSTQLVAGAPVFSPSGGNVGTNGNMTLAGTATINGTLSTPRTGVGTCASGNVDALTQNGQAVVSGGLVKLPQTVVLETPPPPNPMPPTTNTTFTKNTACAGAGGCTSAPSPVTGYDVATLTGGTTPATALVLGNVKVSTDGILHLTGGAAGTTSYYNFNSLEVGSGAQIVVDGPGAVMLNIAGVSESTPINFNSGSTITNASMDASLLQLVYGGTGQIKLNGGAAAAMVVYAPNATASFQSNPGHFYGSIIASTISSNSAQIHYDRNLASEFLTSGNFMLTAFTWKKY